MSVRGFFGGLFLAIGWLIAALSGGCTLYAAFYTFPMLMGVLYRDTFDIQPLLTWFLLGGVFGGIPFVVGIVIIWIGRMVKGNKKSRNYDNTSHTIPEEMRENEQRHLKENLKKDNPFIDEEN